MRAVISMTVVRHSRGARAECWSGDEKQSSIVVRAHNCPPSVHFNNKLDATYGFDILIADNCGQSNETQSAYRQHTPNVRREEVRQMRHIGQFDFIFLNASAKRLERAFLASTQMTGQHQQ